MESEQIHCYCTKKEVNKYLRHYFYRISVIFILVLPCFAVAILFHIQGEWDLFGDDKKFLFLMVFFAGASMFMLKVSFDHIGVSKQNIGLDIKVDTADKKCVFTHNDMSDEINLIMPYSIMDAPGTDDMDQVVISQDGKTVMVPSYAQNYKKFVAFMRNNQS